MTVHHDAKRDSWYYVLDLPRADGGKRRQMLRGGFKTEKLAQRAEDLARRQFGVEAEPFFGRHAGCLDPTWATGVRFRGSRGCDLVC